MLGVDPGDIFLSEETLPPMSKALREFLRSPDGKTATKDEIEELRRLPARGKRPTVDTYFWALKTLRSMVDDPEER